MRHMIYLDGMSPEVLHGTAQREALAWLAQHKERLLARRVTNFNE